MIMTYYLYFDGGSRGNPGIAGSGAVLNDSNMNELESTWFYCGDDKTNNFAEYTGLLKGIEMVLAKGIDTTKVVVRGDSLLVIKQCKGEFKVREPTLIILREKIKKMVTTSNISDSFAKFEHIPRAQNKRADELSNIAMDKKN